MSWLSRWFPRLAREAASPISLLLEGGNVFNPRDQSQWTGVLLSLRAWSGSEDGELIARWELEIRPPLGIADKAQHTKIPVTLTLNGEHQTLVTSTEALDDRLTRKPVSRREIEEGYVLFYSRLEHATVIHPDTIWTIRAWDTAGREVSASRRVGDMMRA
jgi:hypothetical protein